MTLALVKDDVQPSKDALYTAEGEDGHIYSVRPMVWTLAKAEAYWEKFSKFEIFSDDIPHNYQGFEKFIMSSAALWFEGVDLTQGEVVGLMYLADIVPSAAGNKVISASWHASVWDAKASPRLNIARGAIRQLFKVFGLHRLEAIIPLRAGGAIRTAKKLGFTEEGVMRSYTRIKGEWNGALRLAIVEGDEVLNG